MPQPNVQLATPPEVPLGVTLTFAEWQMVVGQLGQGPYQQVAALIDKISRHVSQRIEEFHAKQESA
jgi:hypothetical protein